MRRASSSGGASRRASIAATLLTATVVALSLGLPVGPCLADGSARVSPIHLTAVMEGATSVTVFLEVSGAGLGGYGASLVWDPTVLEYLGSAGGSPPFDDPTVNDVDAAAGFLRFADAATAGPPGPVPVLIVTFRAVDEPPAVSAIDLELTSLFEFDFDDVLDGATVHDAEVCVADHDYALGLDGGAATILQWSAVSGATSYDVIRGHLADPQGAVVCLEDDSLDTTTGVGTEPDNPDTDIPAEGQGFFYLVRFHDETAPSGYGHIERCLVERSFAAGGCTP